jgi:hypothetical protein
MNIDLDPAYIWEMWDGEKWVEVPPDWEPDDFTVQYRIKAKAEEKA